MYANDSTIRYTYNDNGDVTAQYHNSNAKPYVTYTYNENSVWVDRMHKDLRPKKGERSRKDDTEDATYNYLKRFCVRIWGYK